MLTEVATFKPLTGLSNRHCQTLAAVAYGRINKFLYCRRELILPDGDFIDLDWTAIPDSNSRMPILVIFHGLEGSSESHYANSLARTAHDNGWCAVVMNFRSCSGRLNLKPRMYHSGETGDADFLVEWLKRHYPLSPLYAAGFSLGGNMLLKMAGEQGDALKFDAIVSVSAPIKLQESVRYMVQGLSRFYQSYLLRTLKRKVLDKFKQHDYKTMIGLDRQAIAGCQDIIEFDDLFTSRIHGFKDAGDYYEKSSAFPYIKKISQPCLILHALDDPIAPSSILPLSADLPDHIQLEVSKSGGHVGYLEGRLFKPEFWLPGRILSYFERMT